MSSLSLYVIVGIAIKQGKTMSLTTANVVAASDVEALGAAHVHVRQYYPATDGYGQYEAAAHRIFKRAQDPAGRIITVTIEEPAP